MRSQIPFVLQFINTSGDFKDYYFLSTTTTKSSPAYQLRHFIPTDDGTYSVDCFVNEYGQYTEKVIEALKCETTAIRFIEDNITNIHSKVHIFHGPEFNFEGRYVRFVFHNVFHPPTNEPNKFVGVLLYAHAQDTSPHNVPKKLLLYKKNPNSVISYENIGVFDDLYDPDSLAYSLIEKLQSDGNRVDIYYYGERAPVVEKLKNLRSMTLAIQVMQTETCEIHTVYERSCIECVTADIMAAPRQLAPFCRQKQDNRKHNKNVTNNHGHGSNAIRRYPYSSNRTR